MIEKEIQKQITDYLTSEGVKWTKTVTNTKSGDPDLICCWRGKYFALEVKVPGKMPTPLQARKLKEIHIAGGIAMYATSVVSVAACMEQIKLGNFSYPLLVQNWIEQFEAKQESLEL